jgi:tRNA 2-thiouridine synthesizing protein A
MERIDITRDKCPMTWVRVKLKLETLQANDLLEVALCGAGPLKNVPASALEDGHTVVSVEAISESLHHLVLRAKGVTR